MKFVDKIIQMKSNIRISTSVNGSLIVKNLTQLTEANGNLFPLKKQQLLFVAVVNQRTNPFAMNSIGITNSETKTLYTTINLKL